MKLEIRALTYGDLPELKRLQKEKMSPDVSEVGRAWLADEACSLFGAYLDGEIVGVANLRKKSTQLAWLEGIRVHYQHQRRGIGGALFEYLLGLVPEKSFSRAAYATQADNMGSCRLGEKFGFQVEGEMDVAYSELECFELEKLDSGDRYHVPLEKGIRQLAEIPDFPPREVCIGWNYAPRTRAYLEPFGEDIRFYVKKDAVLLQYHERSPLTNEIEYVKSMVYGNRVHVPELLDEFIKRSERFTGKVLICLSHRNLTDVVGRCGWSRGRYPTTGLLFGKDI